MKKLFTMILVLCFTLTAGAGEVKLSDLKVGNTQDLERIPAAKKGSFFSTRNLAWMTGVLVGATALTGREGKVHPVHTSLAGLAGMSYGAFLHSYFTDEDLHTDEGHKNYKYTHWSKWLHIPAMIILPVAGSMAMRDFDKGKTEAEGFGKLHKPAALAAGIGLAVATFGLTFEF